MIKGNKIIIGFLYSVLITLFILGINLFYNKSVNGYKYHNVVFLNIIDQSKTDYIELSTSSHYGYFVETYLELASYYGTFYTKLQKIIVKENLNDKCKTKNLTIDNNLMILEFVSHEKNYSECIKTYEDFLINKNNWIYNDTLEEIFKNHPITSGDLNFKHSLMYSENLALDFSILRVTILYLFVLFNMFLVYFLPLNRKKIFSFLLK